MYENQVRNLLGTIIDQNDNVILAETTYLQFISVPDIAERFGAAWGAQDVYTALKAHEKATGLWQIIIEGWHSSGLI